MKFGKSPILAPFDNGWTVNGEGVTVQDIAIPINPTEITSNLAELRELLKKSPNESEVCEAIEKFVDRFGGIQRMANVLVAPEDIELAVRLGELLVALSEFLEMLADDPQPRSREDAEYYANRYEEISIVLRPFKVSERAGREGRAMLERAEKLPSKVDSLRRAKWLSAIAGLTTDAPFCRLCRPATRMHIVGEQGKELWRCNEKDHGTRWLSREQRKLLEN
jgi:hypothetical protein